MLVHDSVVALYVQLANCLSDAIYQGEYKPGDKLPSENSLCKQYGVSRITVRQALNLLIQQNLAFAVHGKGTFVKAPDISHELNRIISFSRVLQLKGLTGYTRVRGFQAEAGDAAARERLAVLALRWIWLGMRRRHQSFTIDPFSRQRWANGCGKLQGRQRLPDRHSQHSTCTQGLELD